ncbi:hypothetical protein ACQ86N_37270 [Puia sp. P3]|uniref:hypothetical protein n=1 Tax=Puia sp. P3 TaxID=3423952 RepID=UPI003D67BA2C
MRSLLLMICLCCNTALFAQAYIGDPGIRNIKQPAAIIRLPYDDNSVEDALKQYMMTQGIQEYGLRRIYSFQEFAAGDRSPHPERPIFQDEFRQEC